MGKIAKRLEKARTKRLKNTPFTDEWNREVRKRRAAALKGWKTRRRRKK